MKFPEYLGLCMTFQENRQLLLSGSKHALKEHKKEAVATVKKLIMQYKLSMGNLRGKAQKQLES